MTDDVISKQEVLRLQYEVELEDGQRFMMIDPDDVENLQPISKESKTGCCKDCKWWKDSDGTYRRGVRAESQCPINRREVFEGNGYCYMFESQESEV